MAREYSLQDDRELFEAIQFYKDKSSRRRVEADTSSPTSSRVEADSSSPTSSPSPDQKDPPSISIATASNSLIFILRTRDGKSATSDAKPLSANDIDVWEMKSVSATFSVSVQSHCLTYKCDFYTKGY